MAGTKLMLVKQALRFLISQLAPGDCVGLVSYDQDVSTEVPLTFLDETGKVWMEDLPFYGWLFCSLS